jgi:diguanylate cyclase (GGDEF)-like protein/PAS domain S-box-containing protein
MPEEQKTKDHSEAKLGFGIRLLAGVTALLVTLAVPAFYFSLGYSAQVSGLETEVDITAKTAERLLGESTPDNFLAQNYLESPRLVMLLHLRPGSGEAEIRHYLDTRNNIIVSSKEDLPIPFLTRKAALSDDTGETIGYLEISRSLLSLLLRTALVSVFSVLLGYILFSFLWTYPLHALRLALAEIHVRKNTEEDLTKSLSILGATLESTADGILVTDQVGVVVQFNQPYLDIWGIPDTESRHARYAFNLILKELESPATFLLRIKSLRTDPELESHDILELKDGRFIETRSRPRIIDGENVGRVWSFRDITEHQQSEVMLQAEERVLKMMVDGESLPKVLDMLTRYIEDRSGELFCAIYLLDEAGYRLQHISAPSLPNNLLETLEEPFLSHSINLTTESNGNEPDISREIENSSMYRKHKELAAEMGLHTSWTSPILTSKGKVLGIVSVYYRKVQEPLNYDKQLVEIAANLTGIAVERKEAEQNLDYLAHYDALTHLPNRVLFLDRLTQALASARRNNRLVALMFLDLDRFKNINDTLGHDSGDQLLTEVATRLSSCIRSEDTVSRLGGDEFTIILGEINSAEDAAHIAQKLLHTLTDPFNLKGHEVFVSASIGITIFPDDSGDSDSLLKNADMAMYDAKQRGRNNYQFFASYMNASSMEQLEMENKLRHALQRNEFLLYYQAKTDIHTQELIGLEALIRWNDPERGIIVPEEFVHLLEETNLIIPVGKWVIQEVCRQNKAWQDQGYVPIRVAANLSARQLQDDNIVEIVSKSLKESGLDARYLELEVTESTLMENPVYVAETLNNIKAIGVEYIDIDDFGTGYSSLSYLKNLPISTVKIDQSFVRDLPDDKEDASIARAIVAMAHSLDLRVIAEGVENQQQLDFLRELDCDEIQGYLISKPLAAEDIVKLMKKKP